MTTESKHGRASSSVCHPGQASESERELGPRGHKHRAQEFHTRFSTTIIFKAATARRSMMTWYPDLRLDDVLLPPI
jgi:hypothetical protein